MKPIKILLLVLILLGMTSILNELRQIKRLASCELTVRVINAKTNILIEQGKCDEALDYLDKLELELKQ